jgi:carboxyl-terminal processing protease
MNKKVDFKKALAVIIITNLITASVIAFVPIPIVGGKKIVSNYEYNFISQFKKMLYIKGLVETNYVDNVKIDESKMVDSAITGMVD